MVLAPRCNYTCRGWRVPLSQLILFNTNPKSHLHTVQSRSQTAWCYTWYTARKVLCEVENDRCVIWTPNQGQIRPSREHRVLAIVFWCLASIWRWHDKFVDVIALQKHWLHCEGLRHVVWFLVKASDVRRFWDLDILQKMSSLTTTKLRVRMTIWIFQNIFKRKIKPKGLEVRELIPCFAPGRMLVGHQHLNHAWAQPSGEAQGKPK
jgi:hypothetical protein